MANIKYPVIDGKKMCKECELMLPVEQFSRNKKTSSGLDYKCKSCLIEWRKTIDWKGRHFEKRYGVTIEQYGVMVAEQNGLCKICGNPPTDGYGALHIDHDHDTGKVRGLLCMHCNHLLGNAKDNVETLRAAIKYLVSSSQA